MMVKQVTKYYCSICQSEHYSKKFALNCEKSHSKLNDLEIYEIKSNFEDYEHLENNDLMWHCEFLPSKLWVCTKKDKETSIELDNIFLGQYKLVGGGYFEKLEEGERR